MKVTITISWEGRTIYRTIKDWPISTVWSRAERVERTRRIFNRVGANLPYIGRTIDAEIASPTLRRISRGIDYVRAMVGRR